MKISQESIRVLEFDKILEHVSVKCRGELGKARLLNHSFYENTTQLRETLEEVSEMKSVFLAEGGLPLWNYADIRILINKIEPLQSYLEATDCQQIQNMLELCEDLAAFFLKNNEKFERLAKRAAKIEMHTNLRKLILNTIEPSGEIFDNASPELKKIRQQIKFLSKQIHIKLDRILKKQSEHVQENYITLREGRLVIPVREYSVNKIPGIVHGQSATGQTHYIEPLPIVTLNNEIQDLYVQEKREIILILKRISDNIRQNAQPILANLEILIDFDVLQAKAQYSISVNGSAPDIKKDITWNIKDAFHPLLLRKLREETVALNLEIDDDMKMIIITGPNAGGKTVALKTVGLLQLMFQAGFHVPVHASSAFPLCNDIFAVIGDEQSIENDLSTFSSHIHKLNQIVSDAGRGSLVLIDEIGTGTDPSEGAALAIAVLENLHREGITTIVTTHHGELKAYAQKMDGISNAAMQFDRESLTPLFKLETGIPGSSYAFDISKRLGVNEKILKRAGEILGESHHDLEDIIIELSEKKQQYEKDIAALSIKESELDGLKALYNTRTQELKKNKKKYEKEAFEQAQEILDGLNRKIETVIREIKESGAAREVIKNGRKQLQDLRRKVEEKSDFPDQDGMKTADLREGMMVRSRRFAITGRVSKIFSEKNEVELETDDVKFIVAVDDLDTVEDITEKRQKHEKRAEQDTDTVMNELDLRGMLGDDAIIELERYLDQALHSSWAELRVIHGKGTGALRQKIHAYLKKNRRIKSFRLGRYGEGDSGVTIIILREQVQQDG